MCKCYSDFDFKHFMKTFQGNPGYDGRLNGFDVMIMESSEKADKIIENVKKQIDNIKYYKGKNINFVFEYDDDGVLPEDQMRIAKEVERYALSQGIILR